MTAGSSQPSGTLIGPGDDAAMIAVPSGRVLVSVDVQVEGVHFRLDWATPEQVGRRAALAAMSDLAAMGGVTTALVVGLSAPRTLPASTAIGLARGIQAVAQAHSAGVVGGDVTRSDVLTVSITVLGELVGTGPVLRSGAQPGDQVALAGRVGWAAAGLAVLSRGFRSPAAVVGAYREPEPPLIEGPRAADLGATAMIDVSDGLLADVGHIAAASGVAVDLRSAALEVPVRLREVAGALGKDPMEWLLGGGEDHALVATFPSTVAVPPPWVVIGSVRSGSGVTVDGATPEAASGWDHFR